MPISKRKLIHKGSRAWDKSLILPSHGENSGPTPLGGSCCDKPDRDFPELVCGHPLPCPLHTVIIDSSAKPVPTITIPVTMPKAVNPKILKRLKQIANIFKEEK
jgi:hypothetical protein